MPMKLNQLDGGQILEVAVTGKLSHEDYRNFVPEFERLASEHEKISLLFEMRQFHGWEIKAAWDDLKLGFKHHDDVERVAMVGEKKWQRWMTEFAKPFTGAELRYFENTEREKALAWLQAGPEAVKHGALDKTETL